MLCSGSSLSYLTKIAAKKGFSSPAVQFVNTNLLAERLKVLLSAKELKELPDDSLDIFIANPIKWSNTRKQFVGCCGRIV